MAATRHIGILGSAACLWASQSYAESPLPDAFLARVEALASMETLNAELLAGRSATKTLEHWCGSHAMAPIPAIHAELVRGEDRPPDAAQRERLGVGPNEPVKYRKVRLVCGARVLSEADNWYVPSRLTPDMNRVLETTDTPFGKVVSALHFTRETFATDFAWRPLAEGWEIKPRPADRPDATLDIPRILFTHHAVLYDTQHRPFSEVSEHYTREVLAFR